MERLWNHVGILHFQPLHGLRALLACESSQKQEGEDGVDEGALQ